MVLRTATVILRGSGILALLLGLLFWGGTALNLISIHMLLGLLMVLALWVIGVLQLYGKYQQRGLAVSALLLGLAIIVLGLRQSSLLVGPQHWVISLTHLLLGGLGVVLGQISAGRALAKQPPAGSASRVPAQPH